RRLLRVCRQDPRRDPHFARGAGRPQGFPGKAEAWLDQLRMKQHKVLVANRSEIACRIFQACREMGLRSVAIAAPGDEEARHLTYADEVQAVKGYLDVDSIVEACKRSGA